MLPLIIFAIACWKKSFWLFMIGVATAFYFSDKKMEELEERIEELEDKLQNKSTEE